MQHGLSGLSGSNGFDIANAAIQLHILQWLACTRRSRGLLHFTFAGQDRAWAGMGMGMGMASTRPRDRQTDRDGETGSRGWAGTGEVGTYPYCLGGMARGAQRFCACVCVCDGIVWSQGRTGKRLRKEEKINDRKRKNLKCSWRSIQSLNPVNKSVNFIENFSATSWCPLVEEHGSGQKSGEDRVTTEHNKPKGHDTPAKHHEAQS